jgi:hypothetical protein
VKQLDESQGSDSTMTMMVKSRESRDKIEDENDAKSPKIRKKTWSFRALKTNFSRGTRGGTKWRESQCLWGIDGVFAYMKFSMT